MFPSSNMQAEVNGVVPYNSILHRLMFLIYVSDPTECLSTNAKLFVDDTFLFSITNCTPASANDLK